MTDHDLLLQIADEISEMKAYFLRETLTVADITKILGVSPRTIGRKPWLLPYNGQSQYEGIRRWDRREWIEWNRIPIQVRKYGSWKAVEEEGDEGDRQRSGVATIQRIKQQGRFNVDRG